jgi:hypothetical protein
MPQASIPKEITKELSVIRKDLDYIKTHISSRMVPVPEEKTKLKQMPVASRFGTRPDLKPFKREEDDFRQ